MHEGAAVSPGALLIGGTVVGRGAEIGPGVRLDGAVIFDGARIEAGSAIERSIIGFGARVGPRALVRDGVIGEALTSARAASCCAERGSGPAYTFPRRDPLFLRRVSRSTGRATVMPGGKRRLTPLR